MELENNHDGEFCCEGLSKNTDEQLGFGDLGYAKIDIDRDRRCGHQEVIFAHGKSAEQVRGIVKFMFEKGMDSILLTRAGEEHFKAVCEITDKVSYQKECGIIIIGEEAITSEEDVYIVSGGTSDIPVADEAFYTLKALGINGKRIYDVGVAGIHRLLSHKKELENAKVIIAVAGMEGALASVITGLTKAPVIAVPTSIGYGANFGGLSALLAMLNSCASGMSVVNIDNGFGAAVMASRILRVK